MAETRGEPSAGAAFWRFSLAFYRRPGVAPALIALQDDGGFDVNLILYALWLGWSGHGRLDDAALAAADQAAAGLRTEIVVPLRQMRRRLDPAMQADIAPLRGAVAALELMAERAVQERLAALAGPSAALADAAARRADAQANMALYLGPDAAGRAEAQRVRRAFAAFSGRK
jgi:uncharacterized protein (TIGR02444 family)